MTQNICTKEDVKQVVDDIVSSRDRSLMNKLTWRFGIPFVGFIFGLGALYVQIEQNTQFREEGGQFTQQQQEVFAGQVEKQFQTQQAQILQLREDLNTSVRQVQGSVIRIENILLSR